MSFDCNAGIVKHIFVSCVFTHFSNCVSLCALALPPPPALDEEAPANYFNLDPSTSPAVMNIALPPPPGINPPPPGKIITMVSHMQLTSCM